MAEIAKRFSIQPIRFVKSHGCGERRCDFCLRDCVFIYVGQSGPLSISAEIDRILALCSANPRLLSDQTDVGRIGSSTSVRASGHVDGNPVVLDPQFRHLDFQLVNDPGKCSFRFGDR